MPRGGARKGAGKTNTWKSGCKFEDTKLIRVPKAIADRTLELAHSVDEGIDYELEINSIKAENQRLKKELEESKTTQLSLNFDNIFDVTKLEKLRDEALKKFVKAGTQSQKYKDCKKAIDYIIYKLKKK